MPISIEAIDDAINALVTQQQVSYSLGDKSVQNSDKIRQLMELRNHLAAVPETDLAIMQFDSDIGLDGTENTQTVVEL